MLNTGEGWLLYSAFLNAQCLLCALILCRARASALRVLLTAVIFALLSVYALYLPGVLRMLCALIMPLPMALCAFGWRRFCRLGAAVLISGFLLSGVSSFLTRQGMPAFLSATLCLLIVCAPVLLAPRAAIHGACTLQITLCGVTHRLPALVDTGNTLRDQKASVVIVPRALLPLPKGMFTTYIPKGYCLLSAQTAAGRMLVTCFYPDSMTLIRGNRVIPLRRVRIGMSATGGVALIPPDAITRRKDHAQPSPLSAAH